MVTKASIDTDLLFIAHKYSDLLNKVSMPEDAQRTLVHMLASLRMKAANYMGMVDTGVPAEVVNIWADDRRSALKEMDMMVYTKAHMIYISNCNKWVSAPYSLAKRDENTFTYVKYEDAVADTLNSGMIPWQLYVVLPGGVEVLVDRLC